MSSVISPTGDYSTDRLNTISKEDRQWSIKFWGVRGSIPCPGAETVRYGGNTPCVEMSVGGERLIFDGGTGLKVLGDALMSQSPVSAHLFFSHSHWDHIQGFPFFQPAFVKGNSFQLYGASAGDGTTVRNRLHDQMLHPNFPVPLQIMQAQLQFHDLNSGENIQIGEITVENRPLNHPGGAIGYRIGWQDLVVAYATDTEHFLDRLDDNVLALAENADVLIIDATYTDEEYYHPQTGKVGWGHSTWQEAVKVARAAGVKQLVIFHHDPAHNDEFLDRVAVSVNLALPNSILAREGLVLSLASQSDSIPNRSCYGRTFRTTTPPRT
jgi:phosphoribosyl 1,2-cyclic phosphodiesterase